MISIAIPIHNMKNASFFLKRSMEMLDKQTYRDFEIVVTSHPGGMAANTNEAIQRSKGDIIKILYMDDYLASPTSLQEIADNFKGGWLATGCAHDHGDGIPSGVHTPSWSDQMLYGKNTIGSPSVVAFENKTPLLFDEKMSWLLDCDLYGRLYKRYGLPTIVDKIGVIIGVGDHQMTHILTDEEKIQEGVYLAQKYV